MENMPASRRQAVGRWFEKLGSVCVSWWYRAERPAGWFWMGKLTFSHCCPTYTHSHSQKASIFTRLITSPPNRKTHIHRHTWKHTHSLSWTHHSQSLSLTHTHTHNINFWHKQSHLVCVCLKVLSWSSRNQFLWWKGIKFQQCTVKCWSSHWSWHFHKVLVVTSKPHTLLPRILCRRKCGFIWRWTPSFKKCSTSSGVTDVHSCTESAANVMLYLRNVFVWGKCWSFFNNQTKHSWAIFKIWVFRSS